MRTHSFDGWTHDRVHAMADALTSAPAIVGLLAAATFAWTWIDPIVALVGSSVVATWSYGLIRQAGAVLVDAVPDRDAEAAIRARLETNGDRIADLHPLASRPRPPRRGDLRRHPRPATAGDVQGAAQGRGGLEPRDGGGVGVRGLLA